MKIKFEKFDSVIEILPSIYYYKQSFRARFGRGAVIIAWLKWGIVVYIEKDNK